MLGADFGFHWLPVRDAPARAAADRPQRAIALDVLGRVVRVTRDLDCAELEVDPRATNPAAERAVAVSRHGWCGREFQLDSAAVTRALMHLVGG